MVGKPQNLELPNRICASTRDRKVMSNQSILRRFSLFVASLLVFGTIGFVVIEGWPVADSVYMTVITLSTVGFGEVNELTPTGRMFTSGLITMSIVLMACWTAGLTSFLVSGQLSGQFLKRREQKMIHQMKDHVVVCGAGTTGLTVIHRLAMQGKKIVVVASDPAQINAVRMVSPDIPVIEDDPKSEMALIDANVLNAKYLVAAADDDYDNLLIVITGKGLGTDIRVISFAQTTELSSRMLKVGADDVVCPLVIGGEHVAGLINEKTAERKETASAV